MDNQKKYVCNKCKTPLTFNDKLAYEKHQWKVHPSNEFERKWANMDWSKWEGSSFYQDDPYY